MSYPEHWISGAVTYISAVDRGMTKREIDYCIQVMTIVNESRFIRYTAENNTNHLLMKIYITLIFGFFRKQVTLLSTLDRFHCSIQSETCKRFYVSLNCTY